MPSLESKQVERRRAMLARELTAFWTYERFHRRLLGRDESAEEDRWTSRFEALRARLDSIGEATSSPQKPVGKSVAAVEAAEVELRQIAPDLVAEDSRVGASDLRRFLTRVKRLDEEILLGLLGFYLFAYRGERWSEEIIDKVDFLLSRLGEEICGPVLGRDRVRLRSALASLWASAGESPPKPAVLRALRDQIGGVGREIDGLDDLEALEKKRLIRRYRRLKHGLGRLLVEVSVGEAVIETNLAMSRAVRRLHRAEELQIASDFARLQEARGVKGLPEALSLEFDSLRRDMEEYEEGRRWDDVRLETVHRLRRQLSGLRPYLQTLVSPREPARDESVEEPPAEVAEAVAAPLEVPFPPSGSDDSKRRSDLRWQLVAELFERLESVVEADSSVSDAERLLTDPSLPFDLERREVEAFLKLRHGIGRETSPHRLIFTAAAVREALETLLNPPRSGIEGGRSRAARSTLGVAEDVLSELDRGMAAAELDNDAERQEDLRFLRMRLLRSYSALWVETHGPR